MRERRRSVALLAAVLLAVGLGVAGPAAADAQPRAIVVLVDNVGFTEVAGGAYPGFAALSQLGSLGLSTIPLGAGGRNVSAYATIGNGAPVPVRAALPEFANGFMATETVDATSAAVAYARTTGTPTTANIVNPHIVAFTDALTKGGGGISAGNLGSALRAAGLSAALIGNADGSQPDQIDRSAMLVAMDGAGTVETGAVDASVVETDLSAPLGVRTDFGRLLEVARRTLEGSSLVVVETGDLQRARVEAPAATPEAAAAAHARALADTDAFLQDLLPLADEDTLLIVISPSVPSSETARGRSLAPVWIVGGSFPAGGVLSSATTRRTGVMTLHDIAPTILGHLGVRPLRPMIGLPLDGSSDPSASGRALTTLDRAGALHDQRADAVVAFIVMQTLLLAALCIPWLQRRIVRGRWWWVVPYVSGAGALAIVLAPAFGSPALEVALATVAAIAVAIAVALAALRARILALGILATASLGALALDLALGAPLARWSFLGYDLVVGGRFYGIGNEYEGVLVGASVVGAACLVALAGRHRRFAVGTVGVGCLALIGMFALPRLGADAGGALAAAIGVGVTFYGIAGGRFTWKRVLVLAGVLLVLGVTGIALASAFGGSGTSHVSRFVARLARGDLSFASSLVVGKLRANAFLLGSSPWRSVLLAAAAALSVLGVRYRAELRAAYVAAPDLARGIPGLIAGGVAVLLLNDSGVIALATLAPFAVLLVLTLISLAPPAEEPAP